MKRIVVGIDGSRESFDAYRCAAMMKQGEETVLEALFVSDIRKTQVPFIYSGASFDAAYERLYIPVDSEIKELYSRLKKDNLEYGSRCLNLCSEIDVPDWIRKESRLIEGEPAEVLIQASENCDLIVLGQRGENASFKKELIGSTAEELLRRSASPVLICPKAGISLEKILIVHEGGGDSDRAVEYFRSNLEMFCSEILVLIKSHNEETVEHIKKLVKPVEENGTRVAIEISSGPVSHQALELIEDFPADAVVLGAHGHHKLSEYLLGNVTVHIVRKSSAPVFIIH